MGTNRRLEFDADTRRRLRIACRALGTSYIEFITYAVTQALDECEAAAREWRAEDR